MRKCVYRKQLDLETLVATRGPNFPLGRLEGRSDVPCFCIAYRDDNNRPHGTGFILYFERDNPAIFFPDNGIVSGKLKMYPFGTSEF